MKTIYIRMIDGVETLIPVNAKPIDNNIYEIIDNEDMHLDEDATCIYEFFPKDIVRCEIKQNSFFTIKKKECLFILAYELISSTFPNRRIHQLIFLIVKNLGKITFNQLQEFSHEIKYLYSNNDIIQKQHPVVKKWLIDNNKYVNM
jgi:hypothetical protein